MAELKELNELRELRELEKVRQVSSLNVNQANRKSPQGKEQHSKEDATQSASFQTANAKSFSTQQSTAENTKERNQTVHPSQYHYKTSPTHLIISVLLMIIGAFLIVSQANAHEDPIKNCREGSLIHLGDVSITGRALNYMHERFDGHTTTDVIAEGSCGQFEEYAAAYNLGQLHCEALAQSMSSAVKGVTVSGRIFAKFTGPREFLTSTHHDDYDADFGVTFQCYLCTDKAAEPVEILETELLP